MGDSEGEAQLIFCYYTMSFMYLWLSFDRWSISTDWLLSPTESN